MFLGTKDTYDAMRMAFGPVLTEVSRWNREDVYVELPWAPALPANARVPGGERLEEYVRQIAERAAGGGATPAGGLALEFHDREAQM